jgi:hypothetical protein
MATRITQADLLAKIETVNRALKENGARWAVRYKGAFGQVGLDKCRPDDPHSAEDTFTGYMSHKALDEYLSAMLKALWLLKD